MELYEWQKDCLKAWEENSRRGIVHVVTGAGKTILALAAMEKIRKEIPDVQVRIVVHTIQLAGQWRRELRNFFPELDFTGRDIAMFHSGLESPINAPFSIYVVNTARECISDHIDKAMAAGHATFLVCDECHHYTGECNRMIFSFRRMPHFNESLYAAIGLSATPYTRYYADVLVPALGKEICRYDLEAAVSDGLVSDFVILNTGLRLSGEEAEEYGDLCDRISKQYGRVLYECPAIKSMPADELMAFLYDAAKNEPDTEVGRLGLLIIRRKDLIRNASARIPCAVDLISRLREDEKIILFCEYIEQADSRYARLKAHFPGRVCRYHSEMDKEARKYSIAAFKEGETSILVTCKALDEGFDVPACSIGIIISSTAMTRQRIQRLGRILRVRPEKPVSALYYLYVLGTLEDHVYLQTEEGTRSVSLQYREIRHAFSCEGYERAAVAVYRKNKTNLDPSMFQEFRSCVQEGITRIDWLLPEEILQQRISQADDRHARNYWLTMKLIASAYRRKAY